MAAVVLSKAHSAQLREYERTVKKAYRKLLAHARNKKPPDQQFLDDMTDVILEWAATFAVDRVTRPNKKPKRVLTIKQTSRLIATLGEWLGTAIAFSYEADEFVEKARPNYRLIMEHTHH